MLHGARTRHAAGLTKKEKKYLRAESAKLTALITGHAASMADSSHCSATTDDAPIEIQWAMYRIQKIDRMLYPQADRVESEMEREASAGARTAIHALALGFAAGVGLSYFVRWCRS